MLIINPGSSSVKFGIFTGVNSNVSALFRGSIEGIGSTLTFTVKSIHQSEEYSENFITSLPNQLNSIEAAFDMLIQWLSTQLNPRQIGKICYRVVHGGNFFNAPVIIDKTVMDKLESLVPFAPLHQPLALKAIKLFMLRFTNSQHIGCFDTAFHQTMPKVAQTFAIPTELHEQGIKPYGFHGLSYQFIVGKVTALNHQKTPRRLVILHLGSGASICAVENANSIATSMSFSPLDGIPMATRCGAIDASAVLYMIEQLKLSTFEVTTLLNKQSGLLGLSGISGDVRVLSNSKEERAKFALDVYIHRITQELGAMIATLRGLDALVFTGGIGSNNQMIREKICLQLEWLGISLDASANTENKNIISKSSSRIIVYSLATDEELMMAQLVMSNGQ